MLTSVAWWIAGWLGLQERWIRSVSPERREAMILEALDALSREWGVEL